MACSRLRRTLPPHSEPLVSVRSGSTARGGVRLRPVDDRGIEPRDVTNNGIGAWARRFKTFVDALPPGVPPRSPNAEFGATEPLDLSRFDLEPRGHDFLSERCARNTGRRNQRCPGGAALVSRQTVLCLVVESRFGEPRCIESGIPDPNSHGTQGESRQAGRRVGAVDRDIRGTPATNAGRRTAGRSRPPQRERLTRSRAADSTCVRMRSRGGVPIVLATSTNRPPDTRRWSVSGVEAAICAVRGGRCLSPI